MIRTWEFYVAIILGVVALLIVLLLVYLLFFPKENIFDMNKNSVNSGGRNLGSRVSGPAKR
jgi:di/tricarboxylate transporter